MSGSDGPRRGRSASVQELADQFAHSSMSDTAAAASAAPGAHNTRAQASDGASSSRPTRQAASAAAGSGPARAGPVTRSQTRAKAAAPAAAADADAAAEEQTESTSQENLPEQPLLAVMQCLAAAGDHRSLLSAARAHSMLRQAAVEVLSNITVQEASQQQLDSMQLYLGNHSQHVRSVALTGPPLTDGQRLLGGRAGPILRQLPHTLQLHSLELGWLQVQLLPGDDGGQGVLGFPGVAALKQLRLKSCKLLDTAADELFPALAQLAPGLEYLSITGTAAGFYGSVGLPMGMLHQGLQQLTRLELEGVELLGPDPAIPVWQSLSDLRLVAARVSQDTPVLPASLLSGATGLTRLELSSFGWEPAVLAGKPQLQHLNVRWVKTPENAAWIVRLLSRLMSLQQLTCLQFPCLLQAAPPAAYFALTASSRLQNLDLSHCTLPAGVWQHVFPAGRQLPHLTCLEAARMREPADHPFVTVPEIGRLVSCCPGLQHLDVGGLRCSAGAVSVLQGLTGLRTLLIGDSMMHPGEGLGEVCELTRLRELTVGACLGDGLLLQLTSLVQLTRLAYHGPLNGGRLLVTQAASDEPVWRQVLRRHLDHSDPAVAQQAAAALAAEN